MKEALQGIKEFQEIFTSVSRQSQTLVGKLVRDEVRINVRHEELDRFIRDIDKSSNRLSFSILTAAIIIASSIIIHSGFGQEKILGFSGPRRDRVYYRRNPRFLAARRHSPFRPFVIPPIKSLSNPVPHLL